MNALAEFDFETLADGRRIRVTRARPATELRIEDSGFHGAGIELIADSLLASWGRWTRGELTNLGLPYRWVSDKMGEGGIAAGSPRPPVVLPDEEAKTDKAVAQLALRDKSILRRVIKLTYEKSLPIDSIAKILHVNRPQVRTLIRRAGRAVYHIRAML